MEVKKEPVLHPFVARSVDSMFESMQDLVRSGEQVIPHVIFIALEPGGVAIFPVLGIEECFESKKTKALIAPLVKSVWKAIRASKSDLKLLAVQLSMDIWLQSMPLSDFEGYMEARRNAPFVAKPGMAEALFIQISMEDEEVSYHWPYVRGEKEVVFAQKPTLVESYSQRKGLFAGLWPL